MSNHILVWDIETVPDLEGFARANGLEDASPAEVRRALGDDFPKLIYHSIVCIGVLLAHRSDRGWSVRNIAAPHVGQFSERDLIQAFTSTIGQFRPQLVTCNGSSFDLPVLRYRAMIHGIRAPGLVARPYFHRFTADAVDLCDVLSSYSFGAKARLDEIARIMGLPGKPSGVSGADVERHYHAGKIQEIADYCTGDVVNTYRLWLRYELFCGNLEESEYETSDRDAIRFVDAIGLSPSLRSGEAARGLDLNTSN